jgi:hypothetical protein
MSSVPGEELSSVKLDLPARKKLGHPRQNEVSQPQRIAGDQVGLTDSLQPLESLQVLRQNRAQPLGRQKRRHFPLQPLSVKEQWEFSSNMGDQLRKERLHPPGADLAEKAARLKPLLDRLASGDQGVPLSALNRDIDDQPVLGGQMPDDPVGIL